MIGIIIMYGALFLGLFLCYLSYKYSKGIKQMVANNKEEAIPFSRSILTGFISGVIVIVLDRVITMYTKGIKPISSGTLYDYILSITGIIIISILIASFILITVFGLIHRGLRLSIKK